MITGTALKLVPLLIGLFAVQPGIVGQSVSRLVSEDEVILRVPVLPQPLLQPFEWEERKGPKCIPAAALRRALLSGDQQVDFILAGRGRIRAELDDGDFYLQPPDDRVCAGRDAIRSRMGGSCTIERFKQLVPRLRR